MKTHIRYTALVLAALSVAPTAVVAGEMAGPMALSNDWPLRSDLTETDRARVSQVTAAPLDFSKPQPFETMSGGAATNTQKPDRNAFSGFSANLSFEEQGTFNLGNALFNKLWVSSPSSTQASDGLGPLFNARSCDSCHIKDGRGTPPEGRIDATSMFLRLARTPQTPAEIAAIKSGEVINFPDPTYGEQLQDAAVPGLSGEGRMVITYLEQPMTFGDGTVVTLRRPAYSIVDLAYGPLHAATTVSPRVTPQMIGLGLIEAIHPADIAALADPDDTNNDGISGRMALVRDQAGAVQLGRFGWKAQNPTIRAQSAGAFAGDIGISTPDKNTPFGDCMEPQSGCFDYATGEQARFGVSEAPDPVLELVTFYSKNLGVPARRDVGAVNVLRGKQLFHANGCASCHTPNFVTRRDADDPAQAFQLIWPYSDFLLHDMGEGLADGQQVGVATGNEWRTPPLWGIGLTKVVSGHTFFLHDGRARNLEEAILWHGGEAEASRNAYMNSTKSDRDALITYLESL
jgi:CxxC motif-containing protein (DUF1111 family)